MSRPTAGDAHASVMRDISSRGDWRRVRTLYGQLAYAIRNARDQAKDVDETHAELAEALARTFANYEDMEETFIEDLLRLLSAIEGIEDLSDEEQFRFLYKDTRLNDLGLYAPIGRSRRRPKPFEAAVETVRRIVDLNAVEDILEPHTTTAILGGSLSYGRFFNTAGGQEKPSDTDLVLIVPDLNVVRDVAAALSQLSFADGRSKQRMMTRVQKFLAEYAHLPRPSVFQHKLRLWDDLPSRYLIDYQVPAGHYNLAIHVILWDDFQWLVLRNEPSLHGDETSQDGFQRLVTEFREDRPKEATEEHLGFSGQKYLHELATSEVDGGYLTTRLASGIIDGRFYPGVHLNLVLPRFEVRWEANSMRVRLTLLALRWKLLARLEDERQRYGGRQLLSLSHTRHAVFSPHVLRRLDND